MFSLNYKFCMEFSNLILLILISTKKLKIHKKFENKKYLELK